MSRTINESQSTHSSTHGAIAGKGSALRESLLGVGCGFVYGFTSPLVGHPLDTIKTKMQAESRYSKGNTFQIFRNTLKNEGFLALYRGIAPPMFGSLIFRSLQFGAYSGTYASLKDTFFDNNIPFTELNSRVVLGGLTSALARNIFETPLEYIKVKRQTGQSWRVHPTINESFKHPITEFRQFYSGFGVSYIRTAGLMTSFFIMVDYAVRYIPDVINAPLAGPFLKGGVCATLAWWIVWPFENLKNQLQANSQRGTQSISTLDRARHIIKSKGGFFGLYRGLGPGSARSVVANGASMFAFTLCQDYVRDNYETDER